MSELQRSLRNGLRALVRARGIAIVAVLSLGVAVNLAVFSVVHASLLRPLPHPQPDRLVAVWSTDLTSGREHQTSQRDFFDVERQASAFERLAAYYPPGFTLTGARPAERVPGTRASSGIFDVFGVQPAIGPGFLLDEVPSSVSDWSMPIGALAVSSF